MTRPTFADLPRNGTLEQAPYAQLLVALAEAEASVILELRRNQLQKTIVFDEAGPSTAARTSPRRCSVAFW